MLDSSILQYVCDQSSLCESWQVVYLALERTNGTKCSIDVFSNLIPELLNSAHNFIRDGPATAVLTSERPGNVIPVPKISTHEYECIVSRNRITSIKVTFCVLLYNLFVTNFWHSTSLRCLKETAQSWEFYDVFEANRKRLELRALCFPSDQLTSSPPRCQGLSYLTRTVLEFIFIQNKTDFVAVT
jgi:hypothetical protein